MRPFLIVLLLAIAAPMLLPACAMEDEDPYPLALPDSHDGDPTVIIPVPDDDDAWELSGLSEYEPDVADRNHKYGVTRQHDAQYCYEVQYAHYGRPGCWNTYHNDAWLAYALQTCNDAVNQATDACVAKHAKFHYWLTRRSLLVRTEPPYGTFYYGDQFRWSCLGGWPVLNRPNDTDALWTDYLNCEPNF